METKEALRIVSYKLGLKKGNSAAQDSLLCKETILSAITDTKNDTVQRIEAKLYMQALKIVKQVRLDVAKQEGELFLKDNAAKHNVLLTASGLQYQILSTGSGASPSIQDSVTVHYHGVLLNGSVFDSSLDRGKPSTFALKKIIAGWKEGLQLMELGAKFQFFIPQNLAYGEQGSGSNIPPYATLLFTVELLEIHPS